MAALWAQPPPTHAIAVKHRSESYLHRRPPRQRRAPTHGMADQPPNTAACGSRPSARPPRITDRAAPLAAFSAAGMAAAVGSGTGSGATCLVPRGAVVTRGQRTRRQVVGDRAVHAQVRRSGESAWVVPPGSANSTECGNSLRTSRLPGNGVAASSVSSISSGVADVAAVDLHRASRASRPLSARPVEPGVAPGDERGAGAEHRPVVAASCSGWTAAAMRHRCS